MAERSQPSANYRSWPVITALTIVSLPLLLMYVYLFLDTVTVKQADALLPSGLTLSHWRFLWQTTEGKANIWQVTVNTLLFAACTTSLVLIVSSMAGYVLSRLNVPARGFFLAGVMVLHAFPSVTLIIAIFIVLQMIGLYNSLIGVILVKAAIDLPLGIWLMKGFYDTVPWEIEMAGVVDGARASGSGAASSCRRSSPGSWRSASSLSSPAGASSFCRRCWRLVTRCRCFRSISRPSSPTTTTMISTCSKRSASSTSFRC